MKVTGGSNRRVSLAALIAIKPGQQARLIYRVHHARRRRRGDQRKGFTETGYARLLDAAHQQLGGPLVVVWDNSNTHVSAAMTEPHPAYRPDQDPAQADAIPPRPPRRLPRQHRPRPYALL